MFTARIYNEYALRNEILKALGFENYQRYMSSDIWAGIKKRVYEFKGHECEDCGAKARDLHHLRYDYDTMAGIEEAIYENIVPLCGRCHQIRHGKLKATKSERRKKKRRHEKKRRRSGGLTQAMRESKRYHDEQAAKWTAPF